jgi:Glutamyl-tRNAGlu reductase, N-terminal domain
MSIAAGIRRSGRAHGSEQRITNPALGRCGTGAGAGNDAAMTIRAGGLARLAGMALANLIVLNRRTPDGAPTALLADSCQLGTCLREVRIAMQPPAAQPAAAAADAAGYERHVGADAYAFLLQLACGLESQIAGETEILGQIKQAWRDYENSQAPGAQSLRPWMQRLLQDTKEIRTEFVVSLGSATYGSLARRLLGGTLTGPTLLIGAGQLAETVLPFLDTGDVLVWNRSAERATAMLARQRAARTQGRVHLLEPTAAAEEAGWRRAHDVVLCIPADAARDAERIALWHQHGQPGRVLHLGLHEAAGTAWAQVRDLATLTELFGLREAHASQRELRLARARRACQDKAQLARLDDADGSRAGSSNHGWEDLAVFGAFSH